MGTREVAGTMAEVKDVESRACGAVGEGGKREFSVLLPGIPSQRHVTRCCLWDKDPLHLMKARTFPLEKCADIHFPYNFRGSKTLYWLPEELGG